MLKVFLLVRAASTVTAQKVQHYIQFTHVPLALTAPITARLMQRLTLNHVVDGGGTNCRPHQPLPGLVTIVEHAFDGGGEAVGKIMSDDYYIANVASDEQYMIENLMDGVPQFIAIEDEAIVFHSNAPATLKLFDFICRPAEMPRQEFLARLDSDAEWARSGLASKKWRVPLR